MEQQDIGDILDRKPVEVKEAPQEAKTEAPPAEDNGVNRDEKGRFAAKEAKEPEVKEEPTGEKQVTPPVTEQKPTVPDGYVPVAALVDTRFEAREAKRQLQALQLELEQLKAPKPEPVDFYADPDAAFEQRFTPIQQQFEQKLSALTLRASKAEAIAVHGKDAVSEMEAAIGEAMENGDPEVGNLRQQMLSSDDPVGVAMGWYQRRKVLSEVGNDPAAYRQKLENEIREKLMAEMGQKTPPAQAPAVMPSNLAGARNVGSRSGPAWSGPPKIEDIFKR